MGEAGGHFSESGKMLGTRHLRSMQAFDLDPALAQLLHHLVEVAAKVSDLIITVCRSSRKR